MNNYKSVRKRLFTNSEVELKSEKIELGLSQDIKKLVSNSKKEFDLGMKAQVKISALANDAINGFRQARMISNNIIKSIDEFEKQAKELDLDLPSEMKNLREDAKDTIKIGGDKITLFQKVK